MQPPVTACNMQLVLHGAIVLLLGQLAGYVFFRAIHAAPENATRTGMWRMSHAATTMGAVFLIALAPVVPHLRLSSGAATFLVIALIASTYALCVGTVVAALSGQRGTRPRGPSANVVVYVLYVAGALGSTAAGVVLLYGAGVS
jgi:hypothetical protein